MIRRFCRVPTFLRFPLALSLTAPLLTGCMAVPQLTAIKERAEQASNVAVC